MTPDSPGCHRPQRFNDGPGRSLPLVVQRFSRCRLSTALARLGQVSACALMLAGCSGLMPSRGRGGDTVYSAYLKGLMLERSSQLHEALDAYQSALTHDQGSALLHVRVGAAYLKLGKMERALQSFTEALEINPQQPDALRWVAMLHASQGELDESIEAYERLLKIEPEDPFVLSTLADLYVLQGDLPRAIELYQQLIRDENDSTQLHFNLGVLYGRLNRFDEAIQELSRAFELSPDSLDVRIALGLTYELSGRFKEAAVHYEDAIPLDPLNTRLYHHAARAHLNAKHYPEAMANYRAILDLVPRDLDAIMGCVRVWLAQGQFDEAARFLGGRIQSLEGVPELYVALGIVYREAKQSEEAIRSFERAIEKRGDYAQAYFYLAAQLDRLGLKPEARANLRRTLKLDPNHPDALNYLGYLDAEAGENLSEARLLIERALALDPDNAAYLDSLGWVYFKMGKLDESIAYLERAAELMAEDPVIFDHLGEAYFKRRDFERARRSWERALELDVHQIAVQEKLDRVREIAPAVPAP